MTARLFGCFVALSIMVRLVNADEVNVAVASNFAAPMKAIVAAFEQTTDHRVKLSFGSSGKFYAQIKNGAPFSVFFSADQAKPVALEAQGMTVAGSRFTYATGQLALWSAKTGYIEEGRDILAGGEYTRIALANSRLAPYGAAAVEVLDHLELKDNTQAKWVRGENIAQTYQFVRTGNADLGFVAFSQIVESGQKDKGGYWLIPSELHSPILQDVVLIKSGSNNRAAHALMNFVRDQTARGIIESYGYKIPPN